jgi:hypothetical protein
MALGIILLIFIILVYLLFIKGYLFKLLLAVFGLYGGYLFLTEYIPSTNSTAMVAGNSSCSWAIMIPIIILLLAMACTKAE